MPVPSADACGSTSIYTLGGRADITERASRAASNGRAPPKRSVATPTPAVGARLGEWGCGARGDFRWRRLAAGWWPDAGLGGRRSFETSRASFQTLGRTTWRGTCPSFSCTCSRRSSCTRASTVRSTTRRRCTASSCSRSRRSSCTFSSTARSTGCTSSSCTRSPRSSCRSSWRVPSTRRRRRTRSRFPRRRDRSSPSCRTARRGRCRP